jgi:hypothetical protein
VFYGIEGQFTRFLTYPVVEPDQPKIKQALWYRGQSAARVFRREGKLAYAQLVRKMTAWLILHHTTGISAVSRGIKESQVKR